MINVLSKEEALELADSNPGCCFIFKINLSDKKIKFNKILEILVIAKEIPILGKKNLTSYLPCSSNIL